MTAVELVSFVLSAYLAAAVILGACAVASWVMHQAHQLNSREGAGR